MKSIVYYRYFLAYAILLIINLDVYAQYYESGQNPASIKWYSYNTPNFRVIHAKEFERNAVLIGNLLEQAITNYPHLQGKRPLKVVINNNSIYSNGLVAWAPARMELYPIQETESSGNHPFDILVRHEMRHVAQIRNINTGLTKFLSYFFGEHIVGGILGLYIPMWFLEGDAVLEETMGTISGRGTDPDFTSLTKTLLLNNRNYSFNKMTMGSYKDNVPDMYEFGYIMLSHKQEFLKNDIREMPIRRCAKQPYSITPFNRGIKEATGLSKNKYYKKVFRELASELQQQNDSATINYPILNKREKSENDNYINPFVYNKKLYCFKIGQTSTGRIIKLDNEGREKSILKLGYESSDRLYFNNKFLVWSEIKYDKRWGNRQYSIVKIHDLDNNKTRMLKANTRYFAPTINNIGTKVAVVEYSTTNNTILKVLDVATNDVIYEKDFGRYININTPIFSENSDKLYFILIEKNIKSLCSYDFNNNNLTYYFSGQNKGISYPSIYKDNKIIYSANIDNVRNIFMYDINKNKHYQITNSRYGATLGFIDNDTLYFSLYNYYGYDLGKTYIDSSNLQEIFFDTNIPKNQEKKEGMLNLYDTIVKGETKRYHKGLNMFNLHSWTPFYIDLDNKEANLGFTLLSQDALSTCVSKLYYEYNNNDAYHKTGFNIEYKGLFPILGAEAYMLNSMSKRINTYYYSSLYYGIPLYYKHKNSNFNIGITSRMENIYLKSNFSETNEHYYSLNNKIYFKHSKDYTANDIESRSMQYCDITLKNAFANDIPFSWDENLVALRTKFNTPGIFNHDLFATRVEWQKNNLKEFNIYYLSNAISLPKGFVDFSDVNMLSYGVMYKVPLLYPDISLGSVSYTKRILLKPYIEGLNYGKFDLSKNVYSYGLEITSETHLFRTIFPFEIGIQINKTSVENIPKYRMIFQLIIK